jgi:hypothetical protein
LASSGEVPVPVMATFFKREIVKVMEEFYPE